MTNVILFFVHTTIGDLMFYLNCFLLYSILGFLLETSVALLTRSHFHSGILYGPWTPVYGIGSILIIIISHYFFMNLHMPRWQETIIVFLIITIVLTFIEWLGGIGIEALFHKVFWDYSKDPTSMGHYISLKMSFLWGIGSIIFIYVIHPFLDNYIQKTPIWLTIPVFIIFMIDAVTTLVMNIKV